MTLRRTPATLPTCAASVQLPLFNFRLLLHPCCFLLLLHPSNELCFRLLLHPCCFRLLLHPSTVRCFRLVWRAARVLGPGAH